MLTLFALAFQQPARFLPPAPLLIESGVFSVPGGHAAPAVVDLNGDGLEDLVVGQFTGGRFNVFLNTGSASRHVYKLSSSLQAGGRPATVDYGCCIGATPVFADLDGDGRVDLVSGSYTKGVWFFCGNGDGTFLQGQVVAPPSVGVALAPAVADWDGDGRLDLVLGTQRGEVVLLLNEGGLTFGAPQRLSSEGKEIAAQHGGPAVHDFDGDGVLDLLLGDLGGGLVMYRGAAKGGTDMHAGKSVLPAFPRDPRPGIRLKPTVCDWNHDGKADILVGDFRQQSEPVTLLSPTAMEEEQRLTALSSSLAFQTFTRMGELEKAAMAEVGISSLSTATHEQRARYDAALTRLVAGDKALADLKSQKDEADRQLETVRYRRPIEGTVWVLYGL